MVDNIPSCGSEVRSRRVRSLLLFCAVALFSLLGALMPGANAVRAFAAENGAWTWKLVSGMSLADMKAEINEAAANGMTALYIPIDDYHSIDVMPAGTAKTI